MPRTEAVIFDLDGTLVDSEPVYLEAGRRLFAPRGIDYTAETHARFIGVSTRETLDVLRREHGLDEDLDALLREKNALYRELLPGRLHAFPKTRALLELVHGAGIPTAVASGSSADSIAAAIEAADLGRYFAFTLSADAVAHGKPEPDVFLEAARRLGVRTEDAVVVEDAAPGVEAARRAGCRCIAIPCPPASALPASTGARSLEPEYASAELLFKGGQDEFDPQAAFAFITGEQ